MNRVSLLNMLVARYGFRRYLEIGCQDNSTFIKVECAVKTGIDPVGGGTHRMTSDEFFDKYRGVVEFDLAFIDGLHHAEQVAKDVANAITHIPTKDGIVVMHDCLPLTEESQEILHDDGSPRYSAHGEPWCGDVWKAMALVRCWMDCDSATVDADHGLGIIALGRTNTQPGTTTNWRSLKWSDFAARRDELLRVIQPSELRDWLP